MPEKYIRLVQNIYQGHKTVMHTAARESNRFDAEFGLHQGLALSPYMFLLLMDVLTGCEKGRPWVNYVCRLHCTMR